MDQEFTCFDDWVYLCTFGTVNIGVSDNWMDEQFMRWHAEKYAIEELGCTKTKAKNIVRASLTRLGGVEHCNTCNGTFIDRRMFERYIETFKRSEDRETEFEEREQDLKSQKSIHPKRR